MISNKSLESSICSSLTLFLSLSINFITVSTPISAMINISSKSSKYSSLTFLYLLFSKFNWFLKIFLDFSNPSSYFIVSSFSFLISSVKLFSFVLKSFLNLSNNPMSSPSLPNYILHYYSLNY